MNEGKTTDNMMALQGAVFSLEFERIRVELRYLMKYIPKNKLRYDTEWSGIRSIIEQINANAVA